jgi:hypothetical protein
LVGWPEIPVTRSALVLTKGRGITDEMFVAAAHAVADEVTEIN